MKRYKCKECGYIHIGDQPPITCPVCAYDDIFYEISSLVEQSSEYYEMLDVDNPSFIKLLRSQFELCSQLASVAMAMSMQATHEGKANESAKFKEISYEMLKQSAIYSMFLGEFLEFNTESNIKEIENKIKKLVKNNEKFILFLNEESLDEISVLIERNNKLLINCF
ncbi:rubredoxin-like domain-containing protein [Peptostreptococcus canis]|uniref:Rubrerythrin n=1 Tax=Peptostreptococcus canis TaxID=1159213 RepID=A0ABR6TMZ9_9FIRM|nr:rubrerythrin [Peptostreptococcus canis]MBC2576794.1 rubrerythrin [Peptostreptococcus canis]MBP1998903.1 rubrerythrin [Peptostreptococcus canis]